MLSIRQEGCENSPLKNNYKAVFSGNFCIWSLYKITLFVDPNETDVFFRILLGFCHSILKGSEKNVLKILCNNSLFACF